MRHTQTLVQKVCTAGLCVALAGFAMTLPRAAEGEEKKAMAEQDAKPRVELKTNVGTIVIELWPEVAPKTVENFLEYTRQGFYDNTIFHRVMDGFMIQGGGFTPELQKKQTGPPIPLEAQAANDAMTIAMARTSDPNSATSQFFINLVDNPNLNPDRSPPGYTVFGKVVDGEGIVRHIGRAETRPRGQHQNVPVNPIIIESARVL
jgi:peptidyl-prolyl cis-trans isomerase A (cyclophilin A)